MSGPEHYREAERLREKATAGQNFAYDALNDDDRAHGWEQAAYYNEAAQVHATLALAAATVLGPVEGPTLPETNAARRWREVML